MKYLKQLTTLVDLYKIRYIYIRFSIMIFTKPVIKIDYLLKLFFIKIKK